MEIIANLNTQPASHYEKWSVPLLKADTQFNVVEATLKGFRKWSISDEAGSDAVSYSLLLLFFFFSF